MPGGFHSTPDETLHSQKGKKRIRLSNCCCCSSVDAGAVVVVVVGPQLVVGYGYIRRGKFTDFSRCDRDGMGYK